jgi:hypothetical protein
LTHIDDEAITFAEALAREHANILLVAKELERRDHPSSKRRRRHANDHGSFEEASAFALPRESFRKNSMSARKAARFCLLLGQ